MFIFTKGANISGGHSLSLSIYIYISFCFKLESSSQYSLYHNYMGKHWLCEQFLLRCWFFQRLYLLMAGRTLLWYLPPALVWFDFPQTSLQLRCCCWADHLLLSSLPLILQDNIGPQHTPLSARRCPWSLLTLVGCLWSQWWHNGGVLFYDSGWKLHLVTA